MSSTISLIKPVNSPFLQVRQLSLFRKETRYLTILSLDFLISKIEIWSKERWEMNDSYDNMDEIAEHMSEFGLSF